MIVSLVEDDPVVLSLLVELLRAHGHEPRPVLIEFGDTVESGLARLAAENAEVILLDVNMPVPGPVLVRAAQADSRFAKVRYLMASALSSDTLDLPNVRSVAKPYDLPDLLKAISGG